MASKIAHQVRGRLIFFQCNQKLSFKANLGRWTLKIFQAVIRGTIKGGRQKEDGYWGMYSAARKGWTRKGIVQQQQGGQHGGGHWEKEHIAQQQPRGHETPVRMCLNFMCVVCCCKLFVICCVATLSVRLRVVVRWATSDIGAFVVGCFFLLVCWVGSCVLHVGLHQISGP